jgi:hypothetical protein
MEVDCNATLMADEAGLIVLSQSSYTAVLLYIDSIKGNSDDTTNRPQKQLSAWAFEAKMFHSRALPNFTVKLSLFPSAFPKQEILISDGGQPSQRPHLQA